MLVASTSGIQAIEINDSLHLQEVVVTGTRSATDTRYLPQTVTVIERDLLTNQYQTSILPTVVQQVPGLFVTSRSVLGYGVSGGAAGGINMRGIAGGSGQMMVLIDGHPQYQGIYGHPISDSYQTLMAERVEVLRGPASMLYGSNAMGGVINIVTRRPAGGNSVHTNINVGAGSYGTLQAEVANQIRSGKFSSTIAAQYGRTDNHRPRMGFEQYGGYLKLGYDFNNHWNAYVDANITHFNASQPGSTASPLYDADQWITRGMVSAAVENHYGRSNGALSLYTNFGRHKMETGETLDTPNKQSGKSYRNEIAGYIEFRQDLTSWLTVDAGLRVDHHSITGTEWIPQGGIVIRPMESGELKAMVSKGFRNPTMREMYLYPPSNTDLKPERLMNYELAWSHRLGQFNYGLNLFYLKGDNMIQTMPVDGKPRNVNTGEIDNYGLEAEAAYRINPHWRLTTNHSLLHMKNHVLGAPQYKGFLGADFSQQRWNVVAGLQYINGLYTAIGDNEKKENFLLLNATVSYMLVNNLALWVRGENLLAQRYEINAGYPMPRATFMAGANISF